MNDIRPAVYWLLVFYLVVGYFTIYLSGLSSRGRAYLYVVGYLVYNVCVHGLLPYFYPEFRVYKLSVLVREVVCWWVIGYLGRVV